MLIYKIDTLIKTVIDVKMKTYITVFYAREVL